MSMVTLVTGFSALTAILLALYVAWREQDSAAKRALIAGLLLLAAEYGLAAWAWRAPVGATCAHRHAWRFLAMGLTAPAWLAFSLSYGRGHPRANLLRWRPALAVLVAAPILLLAVARGAAIEAVPYGPGAGEWLLRLGQAGIFVHVALLLGAVAVLAQIERTLRSATGTMRWRIKFMAIGIGILAATRLYTSTQSVLFSSVEPGMDSLGASALLVAQAFVLWGLRRGRLHSVDLYPSHTVIYRSLTAVLAGLYLLAVGVLAQLAAYLGDAGNFPLRMFFLLIGLASLAALLLSDRTRLLFKRFVSRHFQRPQYDHRKVWEAFASRTAMALNTTDFCRAVARLISETFEVLSVTVWLVDEAGGKLLFGESTSLSEAKARELLAEIGADSAALVVGIRGLDAPAAIEGADESWVRLLRQCNPTHFENLGGRRVCVPLRAAGETVGALVLGDRVRGIEYTAEELDLLKTMGGQAAASLLTIRLSERLLHAKQFEAFQAMSAFFVHDLKNTSSSLSLMLQNLPRHFGDPSFREDALKAIGQSVTKINDLIRRLSLLRQKLDVSPVPSDLNALVDACLADLPEPVRRKTRFVRGAPPRAGADPAQLPKVLLNLLLNAHEATTADGRIEVETADRDGWAAVTVRDNGSGMSAEFVERSLFQPFRSTKREGLGIGLFHSKMIVDAHRGRLEAVSEPGRGSEFTVRLPPAAAREPDAREGEAT